MMLALAVKQAKRVYLCGNGGSAANAIHIANDFVACGVKAYSLTADIATLTAIANDFSYEEVFSKQLATLGEKGDLLIALSASGSSPNILKALNEAKKIGMQTWAIVGNYGSGPAGVMADHRIRMGANCQSAEQNQIGTGHEVVRWLKNNAR